jgi:hypothetical protein
MFTWWRLTGGGCLGTGGNHRLVLRTGGREAEDRIVVSPSPKKIDLYGDVSVYGGLTIGGDVFIGAGDRADAAKIIYRPLGHEFAIFGVGVLRRKISLYDDVSVGGDLTIGRKAAFGASKLISFSKDPGERDDAGSISYTPPALLIAGGRNKICQGKYICMTR